MNANHNAQRSSGYDFDVRRFFSLLRASASPRETPEEAGFSVQGSALSVGRWTLGVERFSIPNSSFLTPPFLRGFTLFELLAVITIIGIVLAVTLGSFTGWGNAQAVRGSADAVEAALEHARDCAVAQRIPVSFEYQTAVTNALKKSAAFQLVREPSVEAATNQSASVTGEPLGSTQRLPGNVWLARRILVNSASTDIDTFATDRFVFLPNGKVYSPNGSSVLFVVSRKLRRDDIPSIIYRIDIDAVNGTATATKCNPDDPTTYSQ